MFAELLRHPGVVEASELRSGFGFLAYHGGSLERLTEVIATEAAERSGSSLYTLVQPPELRWHIPSTLFTPEDSPRLAGFLGHVRVAVAIHGYGRAGRWTQLLLGGTNRDLAAHLATTLTPALPEYRIVADLEEIPPELRGLHRANPVNLPSGGGVQLELPPRVRGLTPQWRDWSGPGLVPPAEALIDALAAAAASYTGPEAPQSTSKVPPARQ